MMKLVFSYSQKKQSCYLLSVKRYYLSFWICFNVHIVPQRLHQAIYIPVGFLIFVQQRCFWNSGKDIEHPMCVNGKCLTGVRRRYDLCYIYNYMNLNFFYFGSVLILKFLTVLYFIRRNWSWKLWTMPTVSPNHTSIRICAALWF